MSTSRDWRPAGFEQQTARINVTDREWRAFRARCLDDSEHVSDSLARLVRAALEEQAATRERVNTPPPEPKTTPAAPARTTAKPVDAPVALSLFDPGL